MTTREHFNEELAAFLSGDLDERTAAAVSDHLKACSACSRELAALRNVWESLGRVPDELPGPELSRRFYEALKSHDAGARHAPLQGTAAGTGATERPDIADMPAMADRPGRSAGIGLLGWLGSFTPRHPALQFALVFAVLVVGGFIGYALHGNGSRNEEIGQLRDEVRSVNRLLTVSLLQQRSASERLQGVSWSYKVADTDPEVTGALLQALGQDPNVNVRLAALDALSGQLDRPALRGELMTALEKQSSPLIQMAIVDLLARSGLKETGDVLRQMLNKPGIHETVRKRIETALQDRNT